MLTTIAIVIVIYFVAMFLIGVYGRRYADTFSGYLSINGKAGVLLIIGGCVGVNVGNGFVVGGAGAGSTVGLAGAAYGLACACNALISALILNRFICRHGYQSYADYTRERYQSETPGILFDVFGTISLFGVIASQLLAGRALFEALGLNGTVGLLAIALVVFLYSQLAGLWGALATSVVQTSIILGGLILVTVVILKNGAIDMIRSAQAAGTAPDYALNFKGMTPAAFLGMAVPVVLGEFTAQGKFIRIHSAKSERASFIGHLLSFLIMIPIAILPAFIGSYANAVYGIKGDSAFFSVIMNDLNSVIAAITIAAVVAAVMSSIDESLIEISSMVIRDLLQNTMKREYSEKKLKWVTLLLNVFTIVLSIVLALGSESILGIINKCCIFLSATCLVPFVGGVLWKKGSNSGAIASAVVGALFVVLGWCGVPFPSWGGFFPCVPGLVAFVVFSLIYPQGYEKKKA